jgi:hypothetical protein
MSEPRSSRRADHNVAAPGRRAEDGKRRIDIVVALAVALPAVVGLGLAAVGARHDAATEVVPPVSTDLTSATLACPPPAGKGSGPVVVARSPQTAGGPVAVQQAGGKGQLVKHAPAQVPVSPDRPASLGAPTSLVLDASGAAAPGLVAGRREVAAAAPCTTPAYDEWYVGLGASAANDTVFTLTNPDAGQAVVDTTLIGLSGPLPADRLRGLVVPGHTTMTVDLARTAPSRATFAAHVVVSRGRVGISAQHRYDRLGGAPVVTDFVPPQAGPDTSNLLLGASVKSRSLYLANPGDNEVQATVRVLGPESVFTPTGSKSYAVPAQSVRRVDLGKAVSSSAAKGMIGLVVESDEPLLATTRGMANGDLSIVGASPLVTGPTAAIVPDADTKLLLGGATRTGVVNVTVTDAKGKVLMAHKSIDIGAQRGASLALPRGAAVVTLDPRNTFVSASLLAIARNASSVVPIRDTVVHAEVPAVHPR